jgi:hypothetical protein
MVKKPTPSAYLKSKPIVGGKAAPKAKAPPPEGATLDAAPEPVEAPAARETFVAEPVVQPTPVRSPPASDTPSAPLPLAEAPVVAPAAPVEALVSASPVTTKPAIQPTGPMAKAPVAPALTVAGRAALDLRLAQRHDLILAAVFVLAIVGGAVATWRVEQVRVPAAAAAPAQPLTSLEVVLEDIAPGHGADLTWEDLFDRYQIETSLRDRNLERNALDGRKPSAGDKIGRPRVRLILSGDG